MIATTFIQLSLLLLVATTSAFAPPQRTQIYGGSVQLGMGLFDGISKAFSNEEYATPPEGIKASARHILVKSKAEAETVLSQLEASEDFADLAKQYSSCPSGAQGGSLGSFAPGTMVAAFDKVIFNPSTKIGQIKGPVETKFGYHIIVVDKRTGM